MPRRNRRTRRRRPYFRAAEAEVRQPTCDELAARLVRDGLASPLVLEPSQWPRGARP